EQVLARDGDAAVPAAVAVRILDVGCVEAVAHVRIEVGDHRAERRRRVRPELPRGLAVGNVEEPRALLRLEVEGRSEETANVLLAPPVERLRPLGQAETEAAVELGELPVSHPGGQAEPPAGDAHARELTRDRLV